MIHTEPREAARSVWYSSPDLANLFRSWITAYCPSLNVGISVWNSYIFVERICPRGVYDLSLTQNIASPVENQHMGTKERGGGMGWEIGIGMCTLTLHIKSLTNENLLR